jgi:hypothetical protein
MMLRRIASMVFLVALSGASASPLVSAMVSQQVANCCANGMCPRHTSAAAKRAMQARMPGCDMDKRGESSFPSCQSSPCSPQEKSAVGATTYLLPMPTKIIYAAVKAICPVSGADLFISVSRLPETPPPRS